MTDKTGIKKGSIEPIYYFRNAQGNILLLPTKEETLRFRDWLRQKMGYEMFIADTLQQADTLQKRLAWQFEREQQQELERDEKLTAPGREAVRARLAQRLAANGTPPAEKDFIRAYLAFRDLRHDRFKKRFTGQYAILTDLWYDNGKQHVADLHDKVK